MLTHVMQYYNDFLFLAAPVEFVHDGDEVKLEHLL